MSTLLTRLACWLFGHDIGECWTFHPRGIFGSHGWTCVRRCAQCDWQEGIWMQAPNRWRAGAEWRRP